MTRTRCGELWSTSLKVNLPDESVLTRPASSMPCPSLSSTTSSPLEGLFEVLLVTVPVMSAAAANVARTMTAITGRRVLRNEFMQLRIQKFKNLEIKKIKSEPQRTRREHGGFATTSLIFRI